MARRQTTDPGGTPARKPRPSARDSTRTARDSARTSRAPAQREPSSRGAAPPEPGPREAATRGPAPPKTAPSKTAPRAPRPERRDKARNRAKVLEAAAALFKERGVEQVTVDDVAHSAGVGVGTIYRTFGDKGGLVAAILDERERTLQDRLLAGPPPLGPGASDKERIEAFLAALASLVEESYEMLIVSENNTTGARYRIGSYQAWRLHLTTLLKGHAEDPALTADALLAPLAADLYRHQRKELGVSAKRVHAAVQRLADGLF